VAKTQKFHVQVTQDDLDKGTACSGSKCAISKAIKQKFGKRCERIVVDGQKISWIDPVAHVRHIFLTPKRAQELLLIFDGHLDKAATPRTIMLSNPTSVLIPVKTKAKGKAKAKAKSRHAQRKASRKVKAKHVPKERTFGLCLT